MLTATSLQRLVPFLTPPDLVALLSTSRLIYLELQPFLQSSVSSYKLSQNNLSFLEFHKRVVKNQGLLAKRSAQIQEMKPNFWQQFQRACLRLDERIPLLALQISLHQLRYQESNFLGGLQFYDIDSQAFPFLQIQAGTNRLLFAPLIRQIKGIRLMKFLIFPYYGVQAYVDIDQRLSQRAGVYIFHRAKSNCLVRIYYSLYDLIEINALWDGERFSHFNTLEQPDSDVITQGIRIRAKSQHFRLNTNTIIVAYEIRISDGGVQKKFKLSSRRWEIGNQVIQGPGVIGLYPQIYPGCKDFVYRSCTHLGESDWMQGHFVMVSEEEEIVLATVGRFPLRVSECFQQVILQV